MERHSAKQTTHKSAHLTAAWTGEEEGTWVQEQMQDQGRMYRFINRTLCAILECTSEQAPRLLARWEELVFHADRKRVANALLAFSKDTSTQARLVQHYRVTTAAGNVKWVQDERHKEIVQGELVEKGHLRDITSVKRREIEMSRLSIVARETGSTILITDADGYIEWVNASFTYLSGYTAQEAMGRKPGTLLQGPGTDPDTVAYLRTCIGGRTEFKCDILNYHKNGTPYWIFLHGQPVSDADGNLLYFFAVQSNVDARKRAEIGLQESERRFRSVADASPLLIWLTDTRRQPTYYNRKWLEFTGRTLQAELALDWLESVHPDDRAATARAFHHACDRREPFALEYRLRHHTGTYRLVLDQGNPRFLDNGVYDGHAGSCVDITEQRAATLALRESEQRYRRLIELSQDIILQMDTAGQVEFVSPAVQTILGYAPAEFGAASIPALLSHESRPEFDAFWDGYHRTGRFPEAQAEWKWLHKTGRAVFLQHSFRNIMDGDGRVTGFQTVCRDITAARHQQDLLERTSRLARMGGWEIDPQTRRVTFTTELYRMHRMPPGTELHAADLHRFYSSTDADTLQHALRQLEQSGTSFVLDMQMQPDTGGPVWARIHGLAEREGDKTLRLFGTFTDITRRRQTEQERAELHERLALTTKAAGLGFWEWNLETGHVTWDETMHHISGRTPDPALPLSETWLSWVHPHDQEPLLETFTRLVRERLPFLECDFRTLRPDGALRHLHTVARIFSDTTGRVYKVVGICQDVTVQTQALKTLAESEERYRLIVETAQEGIWLTDAEEKTTFVNEAMSRMLGYAPAEMHGRHIHAFMDAHAIRQTHALMQRRREGISEIHDFELLHRDGRRVWARVSATSMRGADGTFLGSVSMVSNMSSQKQAQDEIEKLSLVARETMNGVLITDNRGRIEWANNGFGKISGFTPEETLGREPGDFLRDASGARSAHTEYLQTCILEARRFELEVMNHRKNGEPYWILLQGQPLLDQAGNLARYFLIQTDVTEKKRQEQRIVDSENKLAAFFNSSTDANFLLGRHFEILAFSDSGAKAIRAIHGRQVAVGDNMLMYADAMGMESFKENYERAWQGEQIVKEVRIEHSPTLAIWWNVTYLPAYDHSGKTIGVAFNATNIDQRKKAEMIMTRQNNLLRQIAHYESHTLRRPVASIMGLVSLFDHTDPTTEFNMEIIRSLEIVTRELDAVIHEIVNKTYELEEMD